MSGFAFAQPRARRRPSLTPMIDVVFLLLVFFMLAARFGSENVLQLNTPGASTVEWVGPPRLITVTPRNALLNGLPVRTDTLASALAPMMQSLKDPVLIRATQDTDLQRLISVIEVLKNAGLTQILVVE